MMEKVLEKENVLHMAIDNKNAVLQVELGWDEKEGSLKDQLRGRLEVATMGVSDKAFDLNLAAILLHSDGTEPELVCHESANGRGYDVAGAVVLGPDDRTGRHSGSDEHLRVDLAKVPENVEKIVLFMNIHGANTVHQHLSDVENVFVQVQNLEDCKVYLREEAAFTCECAKDYCCYTFGALVRENDGWALQGMARYSCEDNVHETLKAYQ